MPFYMFFLYLIVVGLAAGWVARLILERHAPKDWTLDFVVGIVGSFLGGLVFSLVAGDGIKLRPSGLIGSIVGAVVVLGLYRAFGGQAGLTRSGTKRR